MADLILDVDFSKVSRAIDELSRLGKLSKDTNRGMAQATRLVVQWQEKFAAQQGRVNAEIEKNVLKTNLANKSARESASVFEEVERQITANTIALNNMRASYDKNFAVEQKTLALKKLLRQEIANGNMTVREAGAELLKYRQNLITYNQVQMATTKTQNRFGVVTQQAGYQIGDFLVQVQSGTNWMVAFGQQATQLAGILPLLAPAGGTFLGLGAGPLLALSAGLGIAIPLVTAIGAAFTRTSKEAEKPIDKVQKFTDALSRFKDLSESSRKSVNDLAEEFGSMATEIKDLDKYLKSVAVSRALDAFSTGSFLALQEPLKDIEEFYNKAESLRSAFTDDANAANKSLQDGITAALRRSESLASDFGLSAESAVKFKNALDAIGKSESLVSIRDNAKAALDVIRQMYPEGAKLPPELANAVEELDKILKAASRATAEMDGTANGARTLNSELSKALSNANAFADAMARARRESAGIGLSTEGVKAQIKVLQGGGSKAEAAAQAAAVTLRGELTSELSGAPSRGTGARIERLVAERYQEVLTYEQAQQSLSDLLEGAGKSGGGKSLAEQLDEYLNKALAEAKLKKEQIGLSEKDARLLELRSKYIEANIPVEEQRIQKIAEAEEELRKAAEAEGRRTSMIQSFSSTIESALMSVVDGSKSVEDAFKGMLRNILLEVYRQQIVDPIAKSGANFLANLLKSANGNVFQGGSQVKAFANGGVVSGPTMFPMTSGVGLMGEAGPEAIMPLKRGANGKLGVEMHGGGGDTINVVQNFSFSANGDESVKKIIAQAAPQIAQMTQQKIMDSRRRGGQMKATFS